MSQSYLIWMTTRTYRLHRKIRPSNVAVLSHLDDDSYLINSRNYVYYNVAVLSHLDDDSYIFTNQKNRNLIWSQSYLIWMTTRTLKTFNMLTTR